MPNRLIKDSIHTSEKVNALSDFQFRLWVNLITYVDDFGRGDARPAVIKGACFPLRDRVTNKDIEAALNMLADTGCVGLYKVDGKPYLYFPNWESHQRIRQKVSKYPSPAECGELRQSAAECGELRLESNPNPESESEEESEAVVVERARENLPDMNSPWGKFVREYENNIGLLPTTVVEREDLQMFFDEFTEDALVEFIRFTARKHPDYPHVYFSTLCRKYLGKNIRTAEQARAALLDYDRQKGGSQRGITNDTYQRAPRRVSDETIL